jgi:hypothetical protein
MATNNKEYMKQYRETHKERIREIQRKWREAHKEYCNEYTKMYRESLKDKPEKLEAYKKRHTEYQRKYRQENKEKYAAYRKEYKKRKVAELRAYGCINPWAVVNRHDKPKFKEEWDEQYWNRKKLGEGNA